MTAAPAVVRRYYAYAATNSIGFYLPVGVLYLVEVRGFGLDVVGLTQAVFSVGILLAEIPTGYLGDRVGRRASLALGHTLEPIAMATFVVAQTPGQYVAIYLLWAIGYTFRSGTEDAWLYEILARRGAESSFSHVKGRANTVNFATSATAALAAGVLASYVWAAPFLANAALSALGLPLLALMPAAGGGEPDGGRLSPAGAGRALAAQARRPAIRWFVLLAALATALFGVTRAFEQPAAAAVGVPLPAFGVMYAGFKLVSAVISSRVGAIQDRLGARGAFGLYLPAMALAHLAVVVTPVAVLPLLFVNRGAKTLLRPIRNQYLNDRLPDASRATVLSGVSMTVSLVAASAKFVAGVLAVGTGPVTLIAWAGVVLAGAGGVLWFAADPVRDGTVQRSRLADLAGSD